MYSMPELIGRKRDGDALTAEELRWIIETYTRDELPDYQVSSLLMAIMFQGMSPLELSAWTEAMLRSGEVLDFSHIAAPKVDKHSTGGVGDKVSIPLAPIAAACGLAVPMMSGRGLGHTGGTLDKLESIPGFRTQLDPPEFRAILERYGLVLAGQSETLVPADQRLYALRDATGTVPSVPLISSSIMSKKLAEGLDALVLDVKVGSGAFMKIEADARVLAETMVAIGASHDTPVVAVLSAMEQPLGDAVGNALEIQEAIDVLHGGGPEDLIELVAVLTTEMLVAGGIHDTADAARTHIDGVIADGSAAERFAQVITAQGGDASVLDDPQVLPEASERRSVVAPHGGTVTMCDALAIGMASVRLGGGRQSVSDPIDPAVGIVLHAKVGADVIEGDPLATVMYNDETRMRAALGILETAWHIGDAPGEPMPLLIDTIRPEST